MIFRIVIATFCDKIVAGECLKPASVIFEKLIDLSSGMPDVSQGRNASADC